MKKKAIIISLSIIIGFIALIFVLWRGGLEITINKEADVKIGTKNYENVSEIKKSLFAKKYKITIGRDNYVTHEAEIAIKPWRKEKLNIELALIPEVTQISEETVSYPEYINGFIYCLNIDRKTILKINPKNKEVEKIDTGLTYVYSTKWSPDGKKAILFVNDYEKPENRGMSYLDDGAETNWYFNLETKELKKLSDFIISLRWVDNENVIYTYYDSSAKRSSLNKSKADGSNQQKMFFLPVDMDSDMFMQVSPGGKKIAMYHDPVYGESDIFIKSLLDDSLVKITNNKISYGPIWSYGSEKILYTIGSYPDTLPSLHIINADGSGNKNLNIKTISAPIYKAVFSPDDRFVYAAVPKELPKNYLSKEEKTSDSFYRIDHETGEKVLLAETEYSIQKMMLSEDEKYIYFISDGFLYSIKIKE